MSRTKKTPEDRGEAYRAPIASRLREISEKYKITNTEMAQIMGVSRQHISNYKNGDAIPDAKMISSLADNLKVSSDYILGRTNVPSTDLDIQKLCDVSGLEFDALNVLYNLKKKGVMSIVNDLLEDELFPRLIDSLDFAIKSTAKMTTNSFAEPYSPDKIRVDDIPKYYSYRAVKAFEYISESIAYKKVRDANHEVMQEIGYCDFEEVRTE